MEVGWSQTLEMCLSKCVYQKWHQVAWRSLPVKQMYPQPQWKLRLESSISYFRNKFCNVVMHQVLMAQLYRMFFVSAFTVAESQYTQNNQTLFIVIFTVCESFNRMLEVILFSVGKGAWGVSLPLSLMAWERMLEMLITNCFYNKSKLFLIK